MNISLRNKVCHITLSNDLNKIKTYYYVQLDTNSQKFMEEFKIKWNFSLLDKQYNDYFIKFALYLYVRLHFINHELIWQSYDFIKNAEEINLKEFYIFLNNILEVERNNRKSSKIKNANSLLDNETLNSIYSAINTLENKIKK